MKSLKISSNGNITIPVALRKKHNLTPGRRVKLRVVEEGILITPLATIEDIHNNVGIFQTNGKMLNSLMEDKKYEREL